MTYITIHCLATSVHPAGQTEGSKKVKGSNVRQPRSSHEQTWEIMLLSKATYNLTHLSHYGGWEGIMLCWG